MEEEKVETTDVVETETDNEPNVEEEVSEVENEESEELTDTEETQEEPSESEEVVDEEEQPKYTKEQVEKKVKRRLERAGNSFKKKESQLINILKAGGFEGNSLEELTEELQKSYEEEGIKIPKNEFVAGLSEREQKALAKEDAKEIIELGEDEMEERFNELYNKEKRTLREEEEMKLIGMEASRKEATKEFVKLGVDPDEMFSNKEFLDFASKMSADVPLGDIYKYYKKLNGTEVTPPKSTGSIKSKGGNTGVKDYYTPKEAQAFTQEQINSNPALALAIEKSMTKW